MWISFPDRNRGWILVLAFLLFAMGSDSAAWAQGVCKGQGVEVQVLGSGGPEVQTKRASSSYVVWVDGKARVLIDAGGGTSLRFGEAGARMEDLEAILITHLHIDHTSDLPALLKSSYFGDRQRPLPIFGPTGNSDFPSLRAFIADLFDPKRGAYRYLGGYLQGGEGGYRLEPHDVVLKTTQIQVIMENAGLRILATKVVHGDVPALAWRIESEGKVIVFSGDTNGENGNLAKLVDQASVFIAHNAIPEGATGAPRELHMPPSVIGAIAGGGRVHELVLSHRMLRSLGHEQETLKIIEAEYSGPVLFAEDLDCFR